jgi:hypothetical protein
MEPRWFVPGLGNCVASDPMPGSQAASKPAFPDGAGFDPFLERERMGWERRGKETESQRQGVRVCV